MLPAVVVVLLLQPGPVPAPPSPALAQTPADHDTTNRALPGTAVRSLAAAGTRPFPDAWQQHVHYTVEARLDEAADVLHAAETVWYRNASPDTLRAIYFHLYLNAFRPGSIWARTEERERLSFDELEEPAYGFERLREARLLAGAGVVTGAPPGGSAASGAGTPPGAPAADGTDALAPSEGGAGAGKSPGEGTLLRAVYPHAPDSTVVRLELPGTLAPGKTAVLRLRWDARPSTLCRRQCRRGRHWDFAQWYPKVAVYDRSGWAAHPLHPQGEFYGEFATFDVTLEVDADQVVGGTGVVVEGDPGWRLAPGSPATSVDLLRDWYRRHETGWGERAPAGERWSPPDVPNPGEPAMLAPRSPGFLGAEPPSGSRQVRFYAEDVHHFAWSADPEFRYEEATYRSELPRSAGRGSGLPGPAGGGHPGLRPGGRGGGAAGVEHPGEVVFRVLYRPGDAETWGGGAVLRRMAASLRWLESVYGPYPWPSLTILHRLEGGGTEFPMLIMNGGHSLGLVLHEMGHMYSYGILANNEWREGWLDEGLTTFQSRWFFREGAERTGLVPEAAAEEASRGYRDLGVRMGPRGRLWNGTLRLDERGLSQPVSLVSEDYADYATYGAMIYTKGSLVFELLRYRIGEEAFRRLLHEYYRRWRFRHVDETALRTTAEDVSGEWLVPFFARWLHAVGRVDYALGGVGSSRLEGHPPASAGPGPAEVALGPDRAGPGRDSGAPRRPPDRGGAGVPADRGWTTRAEVIRRGGLVMPVEVAAVRGADTVSVRVPGRKLRDTVRVATPWRPERVVLDPDDRIMDANPSNNARGPGGLGPRLRLTPHWPWVEQASREAYLLRVRPEAWANDVDGARLGVRLSGDLLGWKDRLELGTWWGAESRQLDVRLRYEDLFTPLGPGSWHLEAARVEGRLRVRAGLTWDPAHRISDLGERRYGVEADLLYAFGPGYFRPDRWFVGGRSGTAELRARGEWRPGGGDGGRVRATVAAGMAGMEDCCVATIGPGFGAPGGRPVPGSERSEVRVRPYLRPELEITAATSPGDGFHVRGRAYAGAVLSTADPESVVPRQRRLFAADGGPYAALANPFLRSRGAPFTPGRDMPYHVPGGGGLRGYDPGLSGDGLLAVSGEAAHRVEVDAWPVTGLEVALFVDAGAIAGAVRGPARRFAPEARDRGEILADAGPGLRLTGPLTLRVDFPLWVSRPALAPGADPVPEALDLRWLFSLETTF